MIFYELVDATSDEVWYPLGIWDSLEAVKVEVEKCKDPDDFGSPCEYEDYFRVDIRERRLGWGDQGKTIYKLEWYQEYSEAKDEFVWQRGELEAK